MRTRKNLFLCFIVSSLLPVTSQAQWVLTNGSSGPLFEDLIVFGSNLFAASWASGVYRSADDGSNWTPANNGLSLNAGYFGAMGTNLFVSSRDQGIFLSTDDGTSWSTSNNGISSTSAGKFAQIGSNLFITTGSGYGIYRSSDNGSNWTQVNNGLTDLYLIALGAIGTTLFQSTNSAGLFRSIDNGENWTLVSSSLTWMHDFKSIGNKIFTGHRWGNGVYRSDNNGDSWTQMNNGLTNGQAIQFAVYGTSLFVATLGGGVFLTTDYGENWTAVNEGLGDYDCLTIMVHNTDLFVGNNGGGIWKRPLSEMIDVSLPVQMTNLYATVKVGGGIELFWKTESEVDCAGFNIWRSETHQGEYKRINNSMIPSQGNKSSATEYRFTDLNVNNEATYWYKIEQVDIPGDSKFHGPIQVKTIASVTKEFALSQNYPNPFNPETNIRYTVAYPCPVLLRIFDTKGRMVRSLAAGTISAGSYDILWNGKDDTGEMVTTGVYISRLDVDGKILIRKIMFLK